MLQPATLNLSIPTGATFYKEFVLPIDCLDREIAAQIWKIRGSLTRSGFQPFSVFSKNEQVADFDVQWIDRSFEDNGITKAKFALRIEADITAQLDPQASMGWDLLVIDGTTLHAGDKAFWLRGAIIIDPTLTEVEADV
jgi:hypothetical protein